MAIRDRRSRAIGLSARLALASLGTAIAIGVVCAVGLSSLENTAEVTRVAVGQQLAVIDDAAAMSAFQYQKGFVAEYLLSGNREWLAELQTSKPAFESWLAAAHAKIANPASAKLLDDIQNEYAAYDRARKEAIALHDSGKAVAARMQRWRATTSDRSGFATCFTSSAGWRARTPSGCSPTRSGACAGSASCWSVPASRARSPACSPASCGRAGSPGRSTSSRCRSSRRRSGRGSRWRRGARGSKRWAIRSARWSRSWKRPTPRSPSTGGA